VSDQRSCTTVSSMKTLSRGFLVVERSEDCIRGIGGNFDGEI
jgi:hypothetical protein